MTLSPILLSRLKKKKTEKIHEVKGREVSLTMELKVIMDNI